MAMEFEPRLPNLFSIFAADGRYTPHRVMLEEWGRALEASERSLARKQASCSAARSDLYQILGLFFVFQGVVLTAAAQSSALRCAPHAGLLVGLSVLVSGAAGAAAAQKLREAGEAGEQLRLERALYRSLHKSLEELKQEGDGFDLRRGQPRLAGRYSSRQPPQQPQELLREEEPNKELRRLRRWAAAWVCSYAGAVLFLLLLPFSLLTIVTVHQILCNPKTSL